jgi:hypothetical protein
MGGIYTSSVRNAERMALAVMEGRGGYVKPAPIDEEFFDF